MLTHYYTSSTWPVGHLLDGINIKRNTLLRSTVSVLELHAGSDLWLAHRFMSIEIQEQLVFKFENCFKEWTVCLCGQPQKPVLRKQSIARRRIFRIKSGVK